jgi:N-acetylglutamate synthase-like GNAT family acetyltransferase
MAACTSISARSSADYTWVEDVEGVDLVELSNLYRTVEMGEKSPQALSTTMGNSTFVCFVYSGDTLIGAGRAMMDGADCAYLADVAIHPDHQGRGLGEQIIGHLLDRSRGHAKIILFAKPGTEDFYRRFGFLQMTTAMALWENPQFALEKGLITTEP